MPVALCMEILIVGPEGGRSPAEAPGPADGQDRADRGVAEKRIEDLTARHGPATAQDHQVNC